MSNLIAIVAAEARSAVEGTKGTLEDKLLVAMKTSYRHWMVTNEDDQLMGALDAVFGVVGEEDQGRIENELQLLQALSAASNPGVTLDLEAFVDEDGPPRHRPIGIRKLWEQAKAESGKS